MCSPSKSTDFQDLLRTDRKRDEVQEFSLGSRDGDVSQTVRLAIFHDLVEHLVFGDQERVVVKFGPGPDLLRFWGGHDGDRFRRRC